MKKYIFLYFILWSLSSCNEFLSETPKGTLIPKTIEDFGLMLECGGSTNEIAKGPGIMMLMDDDVKMIDSLWKMGTCRTYGLKSYCWEEHLFTVSENDPDYNALYHTIYVCNYILNHLEGAKEGGQFTKNYVEGAARFHRAFSYLSLVNLYAKHYDPQTAETDLGVSLKLDDNPNQVPERTTVKAVYDQILEDATKAEKLLEDNLSTHTIRPSKAAAYALLARIYLYRGEYEACWKAAQKARKIIGAPLDYNTCSIRGESGNPDGGINGINFSTNNTWNMPDVLCYKGSTQEPMQNADYNLSDELMNLFDKDKDLRWKLFVTTFSYRQKVKDGDEPRICTFYYSKNKGLNFGEVYLTEAEALVREGKIEEALDVLNQLRTKRYAADSYMDITEHNQEILLQLILDERRRELMFKGTRWFDLKRLNKEPRFAKTITHKYLGETYTLEPNSNRYVLPIPLKVIAANDLLEQNPR